MEDEIPDYYRDLAENEEDVEASNAGKDPDVSEASVGEEAPASYHADAFQLPYPSDDWQDETVYTLTGPVLDEVTHNITIHTDTDVEADSVYDFAAREIALLKSQLEEGRILINDPIELDCGLSAYRAIYVRDPEDDQRLYQEQIFVLEEGRGYALTTTCTRQSRKQLGETIEHMMRSFTPTGMMQEA